MSKVWFITGAGSGIGTGIAKAALRAGDRVVATGRNLEKVRNIYPDVAQENIVFVQLDVANEGQAKAAVDEAMKRFGRIDVLVIEDYAPEGTAHEMWSRYHGTQPGDPAKLGDALVKIAAMQSPPKLFVAGSDALSVITPAIDALRYE